jgi:PAS domain S-box-containing protein
MTENKAHKVETVELRRRAEQLLGEKTGKALSPGMDDEPLRLQHELQVHQIELEMQNAELRQIRDELETALGKYTDLYDFAPVGYFTLDRKGTIRGVNLTGAGLVGVVRSRLVGQRFGLFVTDEFRPTFNACLERVFAGPARAVCEVALLNNGKAPLCVLVEGVADSSGQECRLALIDITERKRAEEALRLEKEASEALRLAKEAAETLLQMGKVASAYHLEEEAVNAVRLAKEVADALLLAEEAARTQRLDEEAAMSLRLAKEAAEANARLKHQFLINMSHELRTPMTGILGMLQIALEEEMSPLLRRNLEITQSSAHSLLRILNDILDMAKFEAGNLTIDEKPFSPRECIAEAVAIVTPEVHRKGLDFAISMAEEVPDLAVGDQMRLRQVLLNLIGNAVKFTDGGKVTVRVAAGTATDGGTREYTFAVTDTGIGIPDDKKDLLFRAFSQVDPSLSRSYGGTGLGLAISKEIVELMGGTISFESEDESGSSFSFTIPLKEAEPERAAQPVVESLSTEAIPSAQKREWIPRLLLAEDDPVIRQVLGLMFKRSNYDLDFAEDGQKVIEMWEKGGYDLVLMDVQMPRLNGFEAASVIREKERERGGHTPIVAMTAHALKEDEERCRAAGMDAYISKPIDFKKSLLLIEEIIKKKTGQNQ